MSLGALGVNTQVAVALYWLTSSADYRTVGNSFGSGRSTMCNANVECLLEDFLHFPKDDDLKDAIQGFKVH